MKNKTRMLITAIVSAATLSVWAEDVSQETVEQLGAMARKGVESVEWGVLLELEGAYAKVGDEQASDLVLATAEFAFDASVTDWLSGHVGLLWEEDDTEENNLDEGFITVGGGEAFPVYARGGRFYLPFGNFESAFISDPATLELGEINTSSVMVGYDNEWFGFGAGAFKGQDEDVIENVYAAVNLSISETVQIGAYWLSDLMETDALSELSVTQKEGGAGAYANLFIGPVFVNAEWVTALSDYTIAGADYKPTAYNLEASYSFAEKWLAGIKFEGSEDFYTEFDGVDLGGKFQGKGYGAVISYGFHHHASISAEYMRVEELDEDEEGDLVTVQLAFEI